MNGIASKMVIISSIVSVTYRPGVIPTLPLEMSHIHTTNYSTGMEILELPDSRVCMKNKGIAEITWWSLTGPSV